MKTLRERILEYLDVWEDYVIGGDINEELSFDIEKIVKENYVENVPTYGLSKRELFAAMAMQGLCADPEYHISDISEVAVKIADNLIDELNKK